MQIKDDSATHQVELPREPVSDNNKKALSSYGKMILDDYRDFKRGFMMWLTTEGKNTYRGEGYSESTVQHTHYKIDEAYRWKWERAEEYTTEFTPAEATELIDFMMRRTSHPDSYIYSFEKSLRRLFKYFREELNRPIEVWEHDIPIEQSRGSSQHIKDKFYPEEMSALYEAALKRYSVPSYHNKNLSSEERDGIKAFVAQRLGKPKNEVTPQDFQDASSWKIPSIIAVSSDCGLRPIEVGRAKADWFDVEEGKMIVPAEESTKNRENWECWLTSKSVTSVKNWLNERKKYEQYRGRNEMWLTRNANPYNSRSLNKTLDNLMEDASIDSKNRKLSWYSFRHGAATLWVEAEGLHRAKNQLRHKSMKTTEKYTRDSSGVSGRPDGLW